MISPSDLGAFAKTFAADTKDFVAKFVEKTLSDQTSRIAALEKRIEQLEQRKVSGGLKWSGTYQQGLHYHEGALCTHDGSLWLATSGTNAIPGNGATSWKLIVKRGEYDKGARR